MTRSIRHWSKDELNTLRELMAKGEKISVMARTLNRSHSSVTWKVQELRDNQYNNDNIRKGRIWTQQELELLREMIEAKKSTALAAQILRRSESSIKAKGRELGYHFIYTQETKCWTCSHAAGKNMCSWARWFEPVKGWTATYREIRQSAAEALIPSYFVHDCPQYKKEARRTR